MGACKLTFFAELQALDYVVNLAALRARKTLLLDERKNSARAMARPGTTRNPHQPYSTQGRANNLQFPTSEPAATFAQLQSTTSPTVSRAKGGDTLLSSRIAHMSENELRQVLLLYTKAKKS